MVTRMPYDDMMQDQNQQNTDDRHMTHHKTDRV